MKRRNFLKTTSYTLGALELLNLVSTKSYADETTDNQPETYIPHEVHTYTGVVLVSRLNDNGNDVLDEAAFTLVRQARLQNSLNLDWVDALCDKVEIEPPGTIDPPVVKIYPYSSIGENVEVSFTFSDELEHPRIPWGVLDPLEDVPAAWWFHVTVTVTTTRTETNTD